MSAAASTAKKWGALSIAGLDAEGAGMGEKYDGTYMAQNQLANGRPFFALEIGIGLVSRVTARPHTRQSDCLPPLLRRSDYAASATLGLSIFEGYFQYTAHKKKQ